MPYAGAPKVDNPLPASVMDRDPCTVIPPDAVEEMLGGPRTGQPSDTGVAKMCSWSHGANGSLIGVQLVYGGQDGLSSIYSKKDEAGFFEVQAPIQGYPVVAFDVTDERQSGGRCPLAIGIADDLWVEADITLSQANRGKADPCQVGRRVAEAALTTLKAGA